MLLEMVSQHNWDRLKPIPEGSQQPGPLYNSQQNDNILSSIGDSQKAENQCASTRKENDDDVEFLPREIL